MKNEVYKTIRKFKQKKEPLEWDEIIIRLTKLQERGSIFFHLSFKNMDANMLSSYYNRWKKENE